jgi:hypothetical protein
MLHTMYNHLQAGILSQRQSKRRGEGGKRRDGKVEVEQAHVSVTPSLQRRAEARSYTIANDAPMVLLKRESDGSCRPRHIERRGK